ncbi:hypothetical protein GCM10020254_43280 [Streptomyces goshikiensis]
MCLGHPYAVQGEFGEPLPAGGVLVGEREPLGAARDQREDGLSFAGVGGDGDPVGAVGPGHGGLHPVQGPPGALAAGADGEFGGVVAGAAVGGGGEDELAAPGAGQQGGGQFGAAVGLDGHRGGAVLQQGHPGQYPRRLAQHQAQGDGVEAGPAVPLGEDQAQQVGGGQLGPQGAGRTPRPRPPG